MGCVLELRAGAGIAETVIQRQGAPQRAVSGINRRAAQRDTSYRVMGRVKCGAGNNQYDFSRFEPG